MDHELETMRPDPVWDPGAYGDEVATFRDLRDRLVVKVWGGDWCPDCRSQLPAFAAALAAAGVPDERVEEYPVERADDGGKLGPKVEEYGIESVPTVVVEVDGEAVARFVETERVPIVVHLTDRIREWAEG